MTIDLFTLLSPSLHPYSPMTDPKIKLKIAIIGGAGHVGSEVALQALENGHTVVALDRPFEGKIKARDGYVYKQLDASDYHALKAAVQGCDALVHLAAVFHQHDDDGNITSTGVGEHVSGSPCYLNLRGLFSFLVSIVRR